MSKLGPPHGGKGLVCCLLHGSELEAEKEKAKGLKTIEITGRENGDLIMMGIGGFSPLNGFMAKADWKSVCEKFLLSDGTFWPVPVTLSCSKEDAAQINTGQEIALKNIFLTLNLTPKGVLNLERSDPFPYNDRGYRCVRSHPVQRLVMWKRQ